MKNLTNLNRNQIVAMIAAFGGTFTGVFSALMSAHCPPNYAAEKADEVTKTVGDDFPEDQHGVVTPISITPLEKDGVEVVYQSRSGNQYTFKLETWHKNSVEYPEDSHLAEYFEKVYTDGLNVWEREPRKTPPEPKDVATARILTLEGNHLIAIPIPYEDTLFFFVNGDMTEILREAEASEWIWASTEWDQPVERGRWELPFDIGQWQKAQAAIWAQKQATALELLGRIATVERTEWGTRYTVEEVISEQDRKTLKAAAIIGYSWDHPYGVAEDLEYNTVVDLDATRLTYYYNF